MWEVDSHTPVKIAQRVEMGPPVYTHHTVAYAPYVHFADAQPVNVHSVGDNWTAVGNRVEYTSYRAQQYALKVWVPVAGWEIIGMVRGTLHLREYGEYHIHSWETLEKESTTCETDTKSAT